MSKEVENYCLVSETGAELFIPNSENRRKAAEKHKEKNKILLSCYEKCYKTKMTSKVNVLIGSSKVTMELGRGFSE